MEFSVIIPTLNEEKKLPTLLKTFFPLKKVFDLEIIVTDDGSYDNTIKIAKKYADKVIEKKEKNGGKIGRNRNRGAKYAQGEILIFFDADVYPKNPRRFFSKIRKKFTDKKIVAAIPNTLVDPKEKKIEDNIFYLRSIMYSISVRMPKPFFIAGQCQIVRRNAFESVGGYDETLSVYEDSELFFRLGVEGKIHFFRGLIVYEDPRRYRNDSLYNLVFVCGFDSIKVNIGMKPKIKEWKRVD